MTARDFAEKIQWLGHDGFRIEAGQTIYFDPYEIGGGPAADVILVTHEHFDHCSPEDVNKIKRDGTAIITEKDSAAKLSGDVRVVKPGDSVSVGDLSIEAVPAYNTNKTFIPKKRLAWIYRQH